VIEALRADGPHPDHAEELMLFGQFVGSWEMHGFQIADDGTRIEHRGEWHFGWTLEGRAIQDVLISPSPNTGGDTLEYGTTIRFSDAEAGVWQIVYVTPVDRAVRRLVARQVGEEIVLEGRREDERLMRWTFSDISPRAFTWRGFVSDDGGSSWRQNEEMRLRRIAERASR
jgi:hypothetical protein